MVNLSGFISRRKILTVFGLFILLTTLLLLTETFTTEIVVISSVIFCLPFVVQSLKNIVHIIPPLLILLSYFIIQNDKDISPFEVLYLVLLVVMFLIYFISELASAKMRIAQFTEDYLFWIFTWYCISLLILLFFNDFEFLKALREILPFIIGLLYFPFRKYVDGNSGNRNILIVCLLLVAFVVALQNIYSYLLNIKNAAYYFEIISSRKTSNEPLFMTMIIFIVPLFFAVADKRIKWIFFILVLLFSLALLLTFSRGYWVGTIIGILIVLFMLDTKNKIQLLLSVLIILLIGMGLLYLLFPNIFTLVIDSVLNRLFSVGVATSKDISFLNRVAEWKALITEIMNSPVIGHGFGSSFVFHDIIIHQQNQADFSHNYYLYILFKTGIIGFIIYFSFYLVLIIKSFRLYKYSDNQLYKAFGISSFSLLIVMLIVSNTSPLLIDKAPSLIMSLVVMLIQTSRSEAH